MTEYRNKEKNEAGRRFDARLRDMKERHAQEEARIRGAYMAELMVLDSLVSKQMLDKLTVAKPRLVN